LIIRLSGAGHIPYIGTPAERAKCNSTETCDPPLAGAAGYTSAELDFYSCLNEFDEGVGNVIAALKRLDYYDNTMIWFTTDNGPEVSHTHAAALTKHCPPKTNCQR
jgi:hypothetical protein